MAEVETVCVMFIWSGLPIGKVNKLHERGHIVLFEFWVCGKERAHSWTKHMWMRSIKSAYGSIECWCGLNDNKFSCVMIIGSWCFQHDNGKVWVC